MFLETFKKKKNNGKKIRLFFFKKIFFRFYFSIFFLKIQNFPIFFSKTSKNFSKSPMTLIFFQISAQSHSLVEKKKSRPQVSLKNLFSKKLTHPPHWGGVNTFNVTLAEYDAIWLIKLVEKVHQLIEGLYHFLEKMRLAP